MTDKSTDEIFLIRHLESIIRKKENENALFLFTLKRTELSYLRYRIITRCALFSIACLQIINIYLILKG
jgi:hypothetical protein